MENTQDDYGKEAGRLASTLLEAENQLSKAKKDNEGNITEINALQKEMLENSSRSISNLFNSQNFEDLIELAQYANPISQKTIEVENTENKIANLAKLIESPYFARIDFEFEGEDEAEEVYIGKYSLTKETSSDILVYDWRSPIASVFYRFRLGRSYYDAPMGRLYGDVSLKRQYEIRASKLEYYFDSDIQIVDEFLRKLLSQNATPRMKAIVETIQKEQDIVIRDIENDLMMVQGAAGSGKTSIALHRAAYLMYQGHSATLKSTNILIISPNLLFEQYISHVLPDLGESNVETTVFDEIIKGLVGVDSIQPRNQFLERLMTLSPKKRDLLKASLEFKSSPVFIEILNRHVGLIQEEIEFRDITYEGHVVVTKEALKQWLSSVNPSISLGSKLSYLEGFAIEKAEEELKKANKKAPKTSEIRDEVQSMARLNINEAYKSLFHDEGKLSKLSEGLNTPKQARDIYASTKKRLDSGFIQYDDALALAYLKAKIYGSSEYINIKQVLIDEAQDYYPIHFEILSLILPWPKYTILGDIAQTIEKNEGMGFYDNIKSVFRKSSSALVKMDKSFRCTNQIINFSRKFAHGQMEIQNFNRDGDEPAIFPSQTEEEYIENIVKQYNACLSEGYKSIGMLTKSEQEAKELHSLLNGRVEASLVGEGTKAELTGALIMPIYMSKGLEFDAVFICGLTSINYSEEADNQLLYVASLRALHKLCLFYFGQISPLLN